MLGYLVCTVLLRWLLFMASGLVLQGGVASRPGSTYTNILTRMLGRMVLNFGFAGEPIEPHAVCQPTETSWMLH